MNCINGIALEIPVPQGTSRPQLGAYLLEQFGFREHKIFHALLRAPPLHMDAQIRQIRYGINSQPTPIIEKPAVLIQHLIMIFRLGT